MDLDLSPIDIHRVESVRIGFKITVNNTSWHHIYLNDKRFATVFVKEGKDLDVVDQTTLRANSASVKSQTS